jgi:eukaryotic translation initiation factor 2C
MWLLDLSSHSAIQGTARPVHYHVILDEAQVPVNDLHKMVYQHCYQYMRSTTPVSLCKFYLLNFNIRAKIS